MGNINNCLTKLGKGAINAAEKKFITNAYEAHLKNGKSEQEASIEALGEYHKRLWDSVNAVRTNLKLPVAEYKGLAPAEAVKAPAEKDAPRKIDQIKASTLPKGDFAPALVKQVENVRTALRKVAPKTDIQLLSQDAYSAEMRKVNGKELAKGVFVASKTDGSSRIFINADRAQSNTVFHEAGHAIILEVVRNSPELLRHFAKQIHTILAPKGLMGKYNQITQQLTKAGDTQAGADEEVVVEFIADIADGRIDLESKSVFAQVKRWLESLFTKLGFRNPYKLNDASDVMKLAKVLSKAFREGQEITVSKNLDKKIEKFKEGLHSDDTHHTFVAPLGLTKDTPQSQNESGFTMRYQVGEDRQVLDEAKRHTMTFDDFLQKYGDNGLVEVAGVSFYDHVRAGESTVKNIVTGYTPKGIALMGGFLHPFIPDVRKNGIVLAFPQIDTMSKTVKSRRGRKQEWWGIVAQSPITGHMGSPYINQIMIGENGIITEIAQRDEVAGEKVITAAMNRLIDRVIRTAESATGLEDGQITVAQLLEGAGVVDLTWEVVGTKNKIVKAVRKGSVPSTVLDWNAIFPNQAIQTTSAMWQFILKTGAGRGGDANQAILAEYGVPSMTEISEGIRQNAFQGTTTGDAHIFIKLPDNGMAYTTSKEEFAKYKDAYPTKTEIVNGEKVTVPAKEGVMGLGLIDDPKAHHPNYPFVFKGGEVVVLERGIDIQNAYNHWEKAHDKKKQKPYTKAQMYYPLTRAANRPEGRLNNNVAETSSTIKYQLVYDDTGFLTPQSVVDEIIGSTDPTYLAHVVDHILDWNQRLKSGNVSVGEVATAYLMAVASINSKAQPRQTVERNYGKSVPEDFVEEDGGIRPEGMMSHLLMTPEGVKGIQDIAKGKVTDEFKALIESGMKTFGLWSSDEAGKRAGLWGATKGDEINLNNISSLIDTLRQGVKTPDEFVKILSKFKYISTGKIGFIGHFLGLTHRGVVDTRQIQAWIKGALFEKGKESKEFMALQTATQKKEVLQLGILKRLDRVAELVRDRYGWDEAIASYLAHHLIWDAVGGDQTTHKNLYNTVKAYAQLADEAPILKYQPDVEEILELFNKNSHRLFSNQGIPKYAEIKKIADAVQQGYVKIDALDEAQERGRSEAGIRAVEASLLLGANNQERQRQGDDVTDLAERHWGADGKEFRREQERLLKQYAVQATRAKAGKVWFADLEAEVKSNLSDFAYIGRGSESDVYLHFRSNRAYKLYKPAVSKEAPHQTLDRIAIHNSLFPETRYRLVGFGYDPSSAVMNGFRFVLSQPYVPYHGTGYITLEEIYNEMVHRGFTPDEPRSQVSSSTEYTKDGEIVFDLDARNVIKAIDGTVQVIDPLIIPNHHDSGFMQLEKGHKYSLKYQPDMEVMDAVYDAISFDNPQGDWLKRQQERAKEYAEIKRKQSPEIVPMTGSVTAFTRRPLNLPVSMFDGMEGAMGEHLRPDITEDVKAERIAESIKENGVLEPILVMVNWEGKAYIWEGNHRLALAKKFKHETIPVEIRWFAGGEDAGGDITPQTVVRYAATLKYQPEPDAKFHITFTRNVQKILAEGIVPFQTSNWVQAGNNERYGGGEVYAFNDITDAIRWGAKMDWEFHKKMGSGNISIIKILDSDDWDIDTNDPLSQSGNRGQWLKRFRGVDPSALVKAVPLTSEMVTEVVQKWQASDPFAEEAPTLKNQPDLLAPNGKPSNLSPHLYKMVRTPEFKKWFGDWENDPKNASKVVDENGEPMVVYHGRGGDFDSFAKNKRGMSTVPTSQMGFFFTSRPSETDDYTTGFEGGNVVPVFLSVQNVFEMPYNQFTSYELFELSANKAKKQLKDLKADGYDGVKVDDTNIYITFEPTQIKSVFNEGAFSPDNPNIRYQPDTVEGFDSAKFEKELESIVLKKDKDGKILAPNGKVSNIQNERLAKTTRTKAFKDWFGDSKVVDENGEPRVVYHGTANYLSGEDIDGYDPLADKGFAGWFSDPIYANNYTSQGESDGDALYPAFLNIQNPWKNPKDVDKSNFEQFSSVKHVEKLTTQGYDGVFQTEFGSQTYGAFKPTQIKSIFNRGTFSPDTADIRYQPDTVEGFDSAKFEKELESIVLKKDKDGKILAPNGKVSNIQNERLAKTIRTKAFKKWFGNSEIVDKNGEPRVVYHGTTWDVTQFDRRFQSTEAYLGQAVYLTSSPVDASGNYASEGGADLLWKIDRTAERMMEWDVTDLSEDEALAQATKEHSGGKPNVLPLFANPQNLLDIRPKKTEFEATLQDDEGEYQNGFATQVRDIIMDVAEDYPNIYWDEIWDFLKSRVFFEAPLPAGIFDRELRRAVIEAKDEHGDDGVGSFVAKVYKALGYDGVVIDASEAFKGMEFLDKGVAHYQVFSPSNVKSIFNRGTFSPKTPDLLKAVPSKPRARAHQDFVREARTLAPKTLEQVIPNIQVEVSDEAGGTLKINASGETVIRTAIALMSGKQRASDVAILGGLFLNPEEAAQVFVYLDAVANLAERKGHDATNIRVLMDGLTKVSTSTGSAILQFIDDAEILKHEVTHKMGYDLAKPENKDLTKRIANFKDFVKRFQSTIKKALDTYYAKEYGFDIKEDIGDIVEEMATEILNGKHRKLGLKAEEAGRFIQDWLEGYAEANGDEKLDNYEEFFSDISSTQKAIRGARDVRQNRQEKNQGDNRGVQEESQTSEGGASEEDDGASQKAGTSQQKGRLSIGTGKIGIRRHSYTLEESGRPFDELVQYNQESEQSWGDLALEVIAESRRLNPDEPFAHAIATLSDPRIPESYKVVLGTALIDAIGWEGDFDLIREIGIQTVNRTGTAAQALRASQVASKYDFSAGVQIAIRGLEVHGKTLKPEHIQRIETLTREYHLAVEALEDSELELDYKNEYIAQLEMELEQLRQMDSEIMRNYDDNGFDTDDAEASAEYWQSVRESILEDVPLPPEEGEMTAEEEVENEGVISRFIHKVGGFFKKFNPLKGIAEIKRLDVDGAAEFAEKFQRYINKEDVSEEDLNRIGQAIIDEIKTHPEKWVKDANNLTGDAMLRLPDGTMYDPDNNPSSVLATDTQRELYALKQSPTQYQEYINKRRAEITRQRREGLVQLASYLDGNALYTKAVQALILMGAGKYSVRYVPTETTEDGTEITSARVRLDEIDRANEHQVTVVDATLASAIANELNEGANLKKAFEVGGLKGIQRSMEKNKKAGYEGWHTFKKSSSMEDAAKLSEATAGTVWCVFQGGANTAFSYLSQGDFHIFFKDGQAEIGIAENGHGGIREFPRGHTKNQSLKNWHSEEAEKFLRKTTLTGWEELARDNALAKLMDEAIKTGEIPSALMPRLFRVSLADDSKVIFSMPTREVTGYGDNRFERAVEEALEAVADKVQRDFVEAEWLDKGVFLTGMTPLEGEMLEKYAGRVEYAGDLEVRPDTRRVVFSKLKSADQVSIQAPTPSQELSVTVPVAPNAIEMVFPELEHAPRVQFMAQTPSTDGSSSVVTMKAPKLKVIESLAVEAEAVLKASELTTIKKVEAEFNSRYYTYRNNIKELRDTLRKKVSVRLETPKLTSMEWTRADQISNFDEIALNLEQIIGIVDADHRQWEFPKRDYSNSSLRINKHGYVSADKWAKESQNRVYEKVMHLSVDSSPEAFKTLQRFKSARNLYVTSRFHLREMRPVKRQRIISLPEVRHLELQGIGTDGTHHTFVASSEIADIYMEDSAATVQLLDSQESLAQLTFEGGDAQCRVVGKGIKSIATLEADYRDFSLHMPKLSFIKDARLGRAPDSYVALDQEFTISPNLEVSRLEFMLDVNDTDDLILNTITQNLTKTKDVWLGSDGFPPESLTFPKLTSVEKKVTISGYGFAQVGIRVHFPVLKRFGDETEGFQLRAEFHASVVLPALTSLPAGKLTLSEGATVSMPALTDWSAELGHWQQTTVQGLLDVPSLDISHLKDKIGEISKGTIRVKEIKEQGEVENIFPYKEVERTKEGVYALRTGRPTGQQRDAVHGLVVPARISNKELRAFLRKDSDNWADDEYNWSPYWEGSRTGEGYLAVWNIPTEETTSKGTKIPLRMPPINPHAQPSPMPTNVRQALARKVRNWIAKDDPALGRPLTYDEVMSKLDADLSAMGYIAPDLAESIHFMAVDSYREPQATQRTRYAHKRVHRDIRAEHAGKADAWSKGKLNQYGLTPYQARIVRKVATLGLSPTEEAKVMDAIILLYKAKHAESWTKAFNKLYPHENAKEWFKRAFETRRDIREQIKQDALAKKAIKMAWTGTLRELQDRIDQQHFEKRRGAENLARYYEDITQSNLEFFLDLLTLPNSVMRALMATGEWSQIGRQGRPSLYMFPKAWFESLKGIKYGMFKSDAERFAFIRKIEADPYFERSVRDGVRYATFGEFSVGDEHFLAVDKMVQKAVDSKIPVVSQAGKLQQRFEHAYTDPADIQRYYIYKTLVGFGESAGLNDKELKEVRKYAAKSANIVTGKGSLDPMIARMGSKFLYTIWSKGIGSQFFAPSFWLSKAETAFQFNPMWAWAFAPKGLKWQATRRGFQLYAGTATVALALSALVGLLEPDPEDDPNADWLDVLNPFSNRFLKVKVRGMDIQLDPSGGMKEFQRLLFYDIAHVVYAGFKGGREGFLDKVQEVAEVESKQWDTRYARGKLAPMPSMLVDYGTGYDYLNRPFTWWGAITSRTHPMTWGKIYDNLFYDDIRSGLQEPQDVSLAQERPSRFRTANILPTILLGGLEWFGESASRYNRGDSSVAVDVAWRYYQSRSTDDPETARIKRTFRRLYLQRTQYAQKGLTEDVARVDEVITEIRDKYQDARYNGVEADARKQASQHPLEFLGTVLNLEQLESVARYATEDEMSILQPLIDKAEQKEGRKARGLSPTPKRRKKPKKSPLEFP